MNKWEDYILYGGDVPLLDLPEPPMPDSYYICTICGKVNNYFEWVCEGCEDPLGGDGQDD